MRSEVAWSKDFLGISGLCAEWLPRLNQDNNVLSFTQFQPEVILGPILLPSCSVQEDKQAVHCPGSSTPPPTLHFITSHSYIVIVLLLFVIDF